MNEHIIIKSSAHYVLSVDPGMVCRTLSLYPDKGRTPGKHRQTLDWSWSFTPGSTLLLHQPPACACTVSGICVGAPDLVVEGK